MQKQSILIIALTIIGNAVIGALMILVCSFILRGTDGSLPIILVISGGSTVSFLFVGFMLIALKKEMEKQLAEITE